ncbi:MAG: hypothetical protein IT331_11170 [Anaerolineae bacterium]|nr:hypothetical protein [Anaerolineae bacterium]
MSLISFYIEVVRALDEIDAPYMIVGAFAGSVYGLTRTTYDVDILVDLKEKHFHALAARFPSPRFYADPNQKRDSTRMGIMFNLIDSTRGAKADLVPLSREPEYRYAFAHRIRRTFQDENGVPFEAWCARLEDVILGKLKAWDEGGSQKHPNDIYTMLVFIFAGFSDVPLDEKYVAARAVRYGQKTADAWTELVDRAKQDAANYRK